MTVLKISDAALATDVPVDTIRYYEKIGLIAPAARSDNNYRGYDPQAVQRLRFIRACRQLDMSVAEISEVLAVKDDPTASCEPAVAVMQEHLKHIKTRIAELRQLQRDLSLLLVTCSGGDSAGCEVLNALDAHPQRTQRASAGRHLHASHS